MSIIHTHPEIVKDWDYSKNSSISINEVGKSSHEVVWWKCQHGHEYKVGVHTRIRVGCKFCNKENNKQIYIQSKIKTGFSKSIKESNPGLLEIWDFENNTYDPSEISIGSNVDIFWKCQCGKSWRMQPKSLARRSSKLLRNFCPECISKQKSQLVSEAKIKYAKTFLKDVASHLKNEWDYEKNDVDFDFVLPVSNTKYWWKCSFGHSWLANAQNRNLAQSGPPASE